MARLPVSPQAIRKLLNDFEWTGGAQHVLAVGGASELAAELRQQFLRGHAEPGAVRLGGPEGADAYVHVLAGEHRDADVEVLRRARLARVPAIAVVQGQRGKAAIPYVLATDVVWVGAGESFPLETVARSLAVRLGERGAPLAARVPLLRGPVCEHLVESFSRRNGLAAAAVGADLPVLALNQVRLVLRLAQAHGWKGLGDRGPELAVTVGAAFGLRALARELLDLVPAARWMVRGGIAYGGTRLLGDAARLRFALAATPQQAAASPVAP